MIKKIYTFIFLIALVSQLAFTQNTATYWNYRTILDEQFLKVGDGQGMSIPAAYSNPSFGVIKWADATIDLGWYMGVLATEHFLIQNQSNYVNDSYTLEDNIAALYYSLKALQRLDLNAETSFIICFGLPNENGFFIRDDVPAGFHGNFNGVSNVLSDYLSFNIYDKEMSQDQVYHLYMGLSLIRKMVGENVNFNGENLVSLATTLATKITNHVVNYSNWTIKNPACNKPVDRGPEAFGLAYGTNTAIKYITNNAVNYDNDAVVILNQSVWNSIGNPTFPIHINSDNTHMSMVLGAIGEIWNASTLTKLMNLSTLQNFYLYPLLYAALYDTENISVWENHSALLQSKVSDMIEEAPENGVVSPQPFPGTNSWGSNNRFIRKKSTHINGSDGSLGQRYNGLDYMLLFNLYQIVYGCSTADFAPISDEPICNEKINIDLTPYGSPSGGFFSGTGVLTEQYFNSSVAGDGTHTLFYIYENEAGCSSMDSIEVVVESCTNTNNALATTLSIFPNPVIDKIWVQHPSIFNKSVQVRVIDFLGRIVIDKSILENNQERFSIDVEHLPSGIYNILFESETNNNSLINSFIKF
jgi:hypothetical protein